MGSIPLVAPRAAAGMKPTQPRSQEKQLLWGPLGSHIAGCYLASEASQCSLSQTLRPAHGVMSLSCLALCWETCLGLGGGGWERIELSPLLRTLAPEDLAPHLSQLGT